MIPVVTVVAFTLMGEHLSKRVGPSYSCTRQVLKGLRMTLRIHLKMSLLIFLSVNSGLLAVSRRFLITCLHGQMIFAMSCEVR